MVQLTLDQEERKGRTEEVISIIKKVSKKKKRKKYLV